MAKGLLSTAVHRDELGAAGLAMAESDTAVPMKEMDPERAARRILGSMLARAGTASIAAAAGAAENAELKSLGVEKLAFAGTQAVKFRQHVHKIPVYGSLITVELDADNNFMAVNSSVGEFSGVDPVAKLSPAQAIDAVGQWAGHGAGHQLTNPAKLYFYFDQGKAKWRLVYIVEDVLRKAARDKQNPLAELPEYSDFVLDAHTGEHVDELPRTQTMAEIDAEEDAPDGLNRIRAVQVLRDDAANTGKLHDRQRNVHTHNFNFGDTLLGAGNLPGGYVQNPPEPWDAGGVSAHANSTEVVNFLKTVLLRDGLDGNGGKIVSSVNCLRAGQSAGREWRNAARIPGQMIYGQRMVNGQLRSYAVALDVVAHELLHGLTDHTARLEYRFQSGALNESYSNIFGIIVSNLHIPNIADWSWEMGEELDGTGVPIRDMRDPTRFGQPAHMDNYRNLPFATDSGGVHINSGIHNRAAFNILTAASATGERLFTAVEVARLFYVTLVNHLSRTSEFVDSRKGAILATRSLFRDDERRDEKVEAIQKAFDAVGIVEPAVA